MKIAKMSNSIPGRPLIGVVVLVVSALHANAALVAYEGFDYVASGDLNGETTSGGTGWTAAWANTGVSGLVKSGTDQSLWFGQSPALVTDGSTHAISSANLGNERDFSPTVNLAAQTLYFTSLIHVFGGPTVVDMRAEFWTATGATGNMRGNVGITNGNLYASAATTGYSPAGAGVATGVVAANTTYLLAMKRTGAGIFASLIAADGSAATLASEPAAWEVTQAGASGVALTSIRLIADGTGGGIRIDELRVATDWNSAVSGLVVPEPGSFILLGLGGLSLVFRRRR